MQSLLSVPPVSRPPERGRAHRSDPPRGRPGQRTHSGDRRNGRQLHQRSGRTDRERQDRRRRRRLLVTPYYNKPTQEGLYLHFAHRRSRGHSADPHNVPGRTVCDMLPDTVERLSKVPNIIGIKEATGDPAVGKCWTASARTSSSTRAMTPLPSS